MTSRSIEKRIDEHVSNARKFSLFQCSELVLATHINNLEWEVIQENLDK
jgi:hypothetical protein